MLFWFIRRLLYFGTVHKQVFFRTMGMNILFIIGINLVFGMIMPNIDNTGHIGGLIGGFWQRNCSFSKTSLYEASTFSL